jgi:prepilin-type N-terminal cleavage/methylation domain-containing protein
MVSMRNRDARERGFTLIEVLVAIIVLSLAMAGMVALSANGTQATAYTRHAGEASMVGQDKLERLRVSPAATLANGTDTVDAHEVAAAGAPYTRTWTVSWSGTVATLVVQVTWTDAGTTHTITYRTMRSAS